AMITVSGTPRATSAPGTASGTTSATIGTSTRFWPNPIEPCTAPPAAATSARRMNSVAETCMVALPLGLRGIAQPGGAVESVEDVRPERVILRDVGVVEVVGG